MGCQPGPNYGKPFTMEWTPSRVPLWKRLWRLALNIFQKDVQS